MRKGYSGWLWGLSAAAIVVWWAVTRSYPSVDVNGIAVPVAGQDSASSVGIVEPARADPEAFQDQLLSHPRVEAYLDREEEKRTLRAYFSSNGDAISDAEAWALIERIEAEGRVIASEGLALKLAWLERNSAGRADFDEAAAGLIAEYRQKAEAQQPYDPYREEPGFARYKAMEAAIIERVQAMDKFPEGLTRQQYLRRQLQGAREEAYGN
ncbi:hypothetical protein [Microbulbifer sediminum]|uniref:hypothetical protein n=1 Tax=Microbulbifer sediminum TaxID=2904250 RepID=UPI001F2A1606|nr:hypothetical protein [Microbulbifer sediminum]